MSKYFKIKTEKRKKQIAERSSEFVVWHRIGNDTSDSISLYVSDGLSIFSFVFYKIAYLCVWIKSVFIKFLFVSFVISCMTNVMGKKREIVCEIE